MSVRRVPSRRAGAPAAATEGTDFAVEDVVVWTGEGDKPSFADAVKYMLAEATTGLS